MNGFIQIVLGGILQGSIYAMLALGFSLVFRVTGVINLAQGGFCTLGALIVYTLQTDMHLPVAVAAVISVAITTLAAGVLGRVLFVPGLTRLTNSNMLMLTAGILTMLEGLVLVIWGSQPYALTPFSGERPWHMGPILVQPQGVWVMGVALIGILALAWMLMRTRLGQWLRACAENPMAARLIGANVPQLQLFAFALAGAIGAIAGIVVAPAIALEFDTGRFLTTSGFISVAIGGIASFPGAIVGGLLLGLVNQLGTAYVSSLFSSALSLALLLLDIDQFKTVNDRHGHDVGDTVLVTIARRLQRWDSPVQIVARLGGEEFAIMVGGLGLFAAHRFAESVRQAIAACDHGDTIGRDEVTVSIGLVMARPGDTFGSLYRAADTALYAAKHQGRNRVIVGHSGMPA